MTFLRCQQFPTWYYNEYLAHSLPQVDAFPVSFSFVANRKTLGVGQTHHSPLDVIAAAATAADAEHRTERSDNPLATASGIYADDNNPCYTTAILKVAYDGTHFSGWTGGNAGEGDQLSKSTSKHPSVITTTTTNNNTNNNPTHSSQQKPKSRQSRRSRTLQRKGERWHDSTGKVRTVDQTIRMALVKLYGNVDPKQIVLEACSRTDAGVHATSLVAQFYCFNEDVFASTMSNSTRYHSPNSNVPIRPNAPNDKMFVPLPFNPDLSKLVYVLNRMLPPDVRIIAASPPPTVESTSSSLRKHSIGAFHPTLCTTSKTYVYQFSIGNIQDPISSRYVWHLDGSSNRAMGINGKKFDLALAVQAAGMFATNGAHDYAAFGSAMRGNEKTRVRNTICTVWKCDLLKENREQLPSWERADNEDLTKECGSYGSSVNMDFLPLDKLRLDTSKETFAVVITGDRFLYKMVRNIVGTIVAVACGHNELEDIQKALATGRWGRGPSGMRRFCAPARGLKLAEVNYPDDLHFDWHSG